MISVFVLSFYNHAVAVDFQFFRIGNNRKVEMLCNLRANLCCIAVDSLTACDNQVIADFLQSSSQNAGCSVCIGAAEFSCGNQNSLPRRNLRHYRFAMPNAVWEYKLKPVEFIIFSYLCYHSSASKPTPEEIAAGIHMTASTVKKYLDSLSAKKLVNVDGTPALKCKGANFFTLPNEVFLLRLPPSTFMVYAYLLLIEDRRTHTCHPSYNTIAAAIGVSKNIVMKSISTLLEMGLTTVAPSSYFDKWGIKWKGNNLYTILPVRPAVDVFYRRQLDQLELDSERRQILRQQAEYVRCHPRVPLCAPVSAPAAPDPAQPCGELCAR